MWQEQEQFLLGFLADAEQIGVEPWDQKGQQQQKSSSSTEISVGSTSSEQTVSMPRPQAPLHSAGHAACPSAAAAPANCGAATAADASALRLGPIDAVAAALQRSLEKQRRLAVEHVGYCFAEGLTPLEAAKLQLACYPFCFAQARAIYACLVPP